MNNTMSASCRERLISETVMTAEPVATRKSTASETRDRSVTRRANASTGPKGEGSVLAKSA